MVLPFYACIAQIREGEARCRNGAVGDHRLCKIHAEILGGQRGKFAPMPQRVLLKINLNPKRFRLVEQAGIPVFERDSEREEALQAARIARAGELGREALAARGEDTPLGIADTGSPVFGKENGLALADESKVMEELRKDGYGVTKTYILYRSERQPPRWVVEMSRDRDVSAYLRELREASKSEDPAARDWANRTRPAVEVVQWFPGNLFRELTSEAFGRVDVWANDRSKDSGLVVHTVNMGGEKSPLETADWVLELDNGFWDARPR